MSNASNPSTASRTAVPVDGIAGLRENIKADVLAGFLVFLVALPLCLGISMASGVPPVSGILTAIVGGILGSLLGGGNLTIKGPAAGLIVIVLGAVTELGAGDPMVGYRRALAVGVVAAAIQIVFALLRAGRLAAAFPPSVVHGMLAAIGVIIFSKQIHTLVGVKPEAKEPLELLAEIPHSFSHLNPEVAVIGALSLFLLFALPRLPWGWAKKVPGPMVVLLVAVPLGLYFNLSEAHTYMVGGASYEIGPNFLVRLPGSLLDAVVTPDFSQVFSATSVKYIVMYALVGTIESLLSAKAVDALDPWRRRSDMNRDLLAVGVGNLLASMVGGLPMISEIVRSSANIGNGARTRTSNLAHGVFLLLFVALLPGLLQQIPLAALSAMLVFTGIRLANPSEFRNTLAIGPDQLAVFVTTLVMTLATDLLVGVLFGFALKVVLHLGRGASLRALWNGRVDLEDQPDVAVLFVRDAAVFSNLLALRGRIVEAAATHGRVVVDFRGARLVDHTVMEALHELEAELEAGGAHLSYVGLEEMRPVTPHPAATRRGVEA